MSILISIGLLIGLALGLTGGGGAILAVPLLVFVADMPIHLAVPVSLAIITAAACAGLIDAYKHNLIYVKPIILFGFGALLATPVGLYLGQLLAEPIRLFAFSLLMLLVAVHLLLHLFKQSDQYLLDEHQAVRQSPPVCRFAKSSFGFQLISVCAVFLFITGLATGILSGFFGVGGGFVIVPALLMIAQMDIKHAIGNSFAIICLIGISASISSLSILLDSWQLWWSILLASVVGMLLGRKLSHYFSTRTLKILFVIAILVTATVTLFKSIYSFG